jgi:hypothetical protein
MYCFWNTAAESLGAMLDFVDPEYQPGSFAIATSPDAAKYPDETESPPLLREWTPSWRR